MGFSASQVQLLSLTTKLSDVEQRAQRTQAQKLALATQKDAIYERYCEALDATNINVAFWNNNGSTKLEQANFKNVCTFNPNRCTDYALVNNKSGLMIVDEKVKEAYDNFAGKDKYTFAWRMIGIDYFGDSNQGWGTGYLGFVRDTNFNNYNSKLESCDDFSDGENLYMTPSEYEAYKAIIAGENGTDLEDLFNKVDNAANDETLTPAEKQIVLDEFREKLYSKENMALIFEQMNRNPNHSGTSLTNKPWSSVAEEFNYYVRIWEMIEKCGGCETIDKGVQDGEEGNQWFNNMIQSGLVSIYECDTSNSTVNEWTETSTATSTSQSYLQELQDETDLKKAEAEYEHELEIINNKDKRFDTELSKLETERTAIKTQIDSVKQVRNDNAEKTFNLFS